MFFIKKYFDSRQSLKPTISLIPFLSWYCHSLICPLIMIVTLSQFNICLILLHSLKIILLPKKTLYLLTNTFPTLVVVIRKSRVIEPPKYLKDFHCNMMSQNPCTLYLSSTYVSHFVSYDKLSQSQRYLTLNISAQVEPQSTIKLSSISNGVKL